MIHYSRYPNLIQGDVTYNKPLTDAVYANLQLQEGASSIGPRDKILIVRHQVFKETYVIEVLKSLEKTQPELFL